MVSYGAPRGLWREYWVQLGFISLISVGSIPTPATNPNPDHEDEMIETEILHPVEHTLIDHILTNMTKILDFGPGVYEVYTPDRKWSKQFYALSRARAIALGYFDRGDFAKIPLDAVLVCRDQNAVSREDLIQDHKDPIMPGSGKTNPR